MRRRAARLSGLPSHRTSPAVGSEDSEHDPHRGGLARAVAPTKPNNSPAWTSKPRSRTATVSPVSFRDPLISRLRSVLMFPPVQSPRVRVSKSSRLFAWGYRTAQDASLSPQQATRVPQCAAKRMNVASRYAASRCVSARRPNAASRSTQRLRRPRFASRSTPTMHQPLQTDKTAERLARFNSRSHDRAGRSHLVHTREQWQLPDGLALEDSISGLRRDHVLREGPRIRRLARVTASRLCLRARIDRHWAQCRWTGERRGTT